MCTVTSDQSNKREAVDFFSVILKRFAATSCYSIRPYRQVPLNERKKSLSQYIDIYHHHRRSRQLFFLSLHNYFLAKRARSSMPQLLEERRTSMNDQTRQH